MLCVGLALGAQACGGSAEVSPSPTLAVDFGEVPLGGTFERVIRTGGAQRSEGSAHPELRSIAVDDGQRLRLVWTPARLGPLSVRLEPTVGGPSLLVTGVARAPRVEVVPAEVQLGEVRVGEDAWAPLWVWIETERPVAFGLGLPICGEDELCVQSGDARGPPEREEAGQRGLPQALAVRARPSATGPLEGFVRLSPCPDSACDVVVPVRARGVSGGARCSPSVVSFDAVRVGDTLERALACEGVDLLAARITAGPFEVVGTSTSGLTLRFAAAEAGVVSGELEVGGLAIPLFAQGVISPACSLRAGPSPLVFGAVPSGASADRTVRVESLLNEPCLLGAPVAGPAPAFSIVAPGVPARWLEPGERQALPLRFSPRTLGPVEGALHIAPGVELALWGVGVQGEAVVAPDALALEPVAHCVSDAAFVTVENIGLGPLQLRSAGIEGRDRDSFQWRGALPDRIPPGALRVFEVVFVGWSRAGAHSAELILSMDSGTSSFDRRIPLSAIAPSVPWVEERHQQLELPALDLLLVVDPSFDVVAGPIVQENLQSFGDFIQAHVRVRAAVITPDRSAARLGAAVGPEGSEIVTSTGAPNFGQALADRFVSSTSTASEGLGAALLALTATVGPMRGFLRTDATLSIIVISPREDETPLALDTLVPDLWSLKGFRSGHLLSLSAIVGMPPDGCEAAWVSAVAAPRYVEVAQRTGGVAESVCWRNWAQSLTNLGTTAFGFKSRFFLNQTPDPSSLSIEVNGRPVPAIAGDLSVRWRYDSATNSINFSPLAVPEPGATILIRYRPSCS